MADKRITSRLKVYMTRIGVRDWLVAAGSQKAALKAWDIHRNLFSTGEARVTNDAGHVALAMKSPGLPVAAPGRVVAPEEKSNVVRLASFRPDKAEPPRAKTPPPKPLADRSKLEAVERELKDFEREVVQRRGEIEKRKRTLETEIEAMDAEIERTRARLTKRIERERAALMDD
ncbi:MAG: hypothetical protein KBA31_09450 [Alphaproteobacteria bacterium]|nr:hypothetical protein [Alphaproteobacteria bacterium]